MSDEEQKKQFAIMIADAIQQLLRESDELAELLTWAHQEGYEVFLSIFSGIVIKRQGENLSESSDADDQNSAPLPEKFEFTDSDRAFLKSIGIQEPE
jgi:hypothetical protein